MAALAGCMLKRIELVSPILKFELRGVEVKLHGVRQYYSSEGKWWKTGVKKPVEKPTGK